MSVVHERISSPEFEVLFEQNLSRMKMLPAVALDALQLLKCSQCSVHEFTTIVERDVTLASTMLRIANSPVYTLQRETSNLQQAVVRLGLRECRHLIMSSCVATLTRQLDFKEEWIRDLLWRHSLYTGTVARHLNRTLSCGFQGEEFTAGLLHDLGRLLLANLFPNEFLTFDPLEFLEDEDPTEREAGKFGLTHVQVAEKYGQLSRLPDELLAVIRWHHAPERATQHHKLVALIAAADDMANYFQRSGDSSGYEATQNRGLSALLKCGVLTTPEQFLRAAPATLEAAASDMHSQNAL